MDRVAEQSSGWTDVVEQSSGAEQWSRVVEQSRVVKQMDRVVEQSSGAE